MSRRSQKLAIDRGHAAYDVLRPVVRLLKACGVADRTIAAALSSACRRYAGTRKRGIWLETDYVLQLAELVTVWSQDTEFIGEAGVPKILNLGRAEPSFSRLVAKANVAVRAGQALRQLRAFGSVRTLDKGRRVRLVSHVLPTVAGRRFLAALVLNDIRRFGETIEHNAFSNPGALDGRMQRWAHSKSVDPRFMPEVERFVRANGQTLLDAVDEKLGACGLRGGRRRGIHYGVGLYVFVDRGIRRRGYRRNSARAGAVE